MSLHLFGAQISKYSLAIQNRRRVRRSVSRVWLKRHLHTLSICCVFLLLCGFKAFKRFCIWVMSSPLKNSTFTGSKRVLKRAMVLSSTSGLYLYYSTTPYTEVQIGLIYTALLRCKIARINHAKYTAFCGVNLAIYTPFYRAILQGLFRTNLRYY